MKSILRATAFGLLVPFIFALAGCGTAAAPATTTTFAGTIAGGASESGTISFTVNKVIATSRSAEPPSRASITISGTLTFTGANPVTLTGTYDTVTGAVSATGGGYTFTGTLTTGTGANVSGTYTSPTNGGGGSFSLNVSTPTTAVTAYCGTFTGSKTLSGTWNIQTNGTAGGGAWSSSQDSGSLTCTQTNKTLNCTGTDTNGYSDTATITISGTSINGTWTSSSPASGTLTGTTCP
jgi:hypothetical protein